MFGVRNLSPRKNGELAPARSADRAERAYVAPRDLTETLLADIWESVLGKTPVVITSNFS
jgi:hypothetical protein